MVRLQALLYNQTRIICQAQLKTTVFFQFGVAALNTETDQCLSYGFDCKGKLSDQRSGKQTKRETVEVTLWAN